MDSIWQLIKNGGITMAVLVACSIISLTFIIERAIVYFRAGRLSAEKLLESVKGSLKSVRNIDSAMNACIQANTPAGRVFAAGLKASKSGKSKVEKVMEEAAADEVAILEKRLVTIGTLGNVSPFIGLFGTVVGVTYAFLSISASQSMGSGDLGGIGAGISQALVTTAAGLFVAVPSVIAFNYYNSMVTKMASEMERGGNKLLDMLGISKEK